MCTEVFCGQSEVFPKFALEVVLSGPMKTEPLGYDALAKLPTPPALSVRGAYRKVRRSARVVAANVSLRSRFQQICDERNDDVPMWADRIGQADRRPHLH